MSQITERTNIISISEIPPVPEVHASMVNIGELSNYQPLNISLSGLKSFCPDNIMAALNATSGGLNFQKSSGSVCSSNSLRAIFHNSFAPTVNKMQAKGLSSLDAKKASLLSALSKMDFKVTDSQAVTNGIKAVVTAKEEKALNTEIKALMTNLEVTHTKVFASSLAKACAAASVKVGFSQVTIKPVNGRLEVIARNQEGKHLVSEISVDEKTNQVNCSTETIGIADGSCTPIIQQFNDELKKMGIKIGGEKTTFTGGTCQMSYSKMIDQQEKELQRKKKEQERAKKLNTSHKIKI